MRSKTLLLVEDNPDHEELTLRTLRQNKVINEIVVARDGEQALDYLFGQGKYDGRDVSQQPELILLDLKLPKIDGLEVLARLRKDERTALIPVVILTSSSEEEDMAKSYKLGANSYVRKPVSFSQFTDRLQQVQVYWLLVNESPTKGG
ncbi:MAG TPA: response regulator [Burkholderiales bacterium]|nr:response regulator [Burkholderiales bacterium]